MNLFAEPAGSADRSRQLADLLDALDRAQELARLLSTSRPDDREVKLLFGRLEAVRTEAEKIGFTQGMVAMEEVDPKWTGLLPWRTVAEF